MIPKTPIYKARFLQINANRSAAAMDLAVATAANYRADYLVVSEPNIAYTKKSGWFNDSRNDASIRATGNGPHFLESGGGRGFVWVRTSGFVLYSCYISPNIPKELFEKTVQEIMLEVVRQQHKNVIITGDFNAKASEWGGPGVEDQRGVILQEAFASLDLTVLNETGKWTFERRGTGSVIDLTAVSGEIASHANSWEVLEEEPLSPHKYIFFVVGDKERTNNRWTYGAINGTKFGDLIEARMVEGEPINYSAFVRKVGDIYKEATPKVRTTNGVIPYWWEEGISELRGVAIGKRRALSRLRRRVDSDQREITSLEEELKTAKKELKTAISKAKRRAWENVCKSIDDDVFGEGYKIATKMMGLKPPSLKLSIEDKLREVGRLFPEVPIRTWRRKDTGDIEEFSVS